MKILNGMLRAAEVAVLAALAVCLIEGARLERTARVDLAANAQELRATLTDLHRVVLSFGGSAAELRKTMKTVESAADEQRRYSVNLEREVKKNFADSDKAIQSANALIEKTDSNLNQKVLPQLAASAQKLGAAADAGTQAIQALDLRLSDPHLTDTIAHMDSASAHVDSITASADDIGHQIDRKVRQALKPVSLVKRGLKFMIGFATKVGANAVAFSF